MKIGIDIDNVISNFDEELLKRFLEHDKKVNNSGIINPDKYIDKGMFDWSKEETKSFYESIIQDMIINLKPINNSKETIDKLINRGHEIYIISSRDNGEYPNPHEVTKQWLQRYDIKYDKLIIIGTLGKVCKDNKIDIMIDDIIANCREIAEKGTRCYIMNTDFNKNNTEFERVMNWDELYNKILNLEKNQNK